jgi:selenocysteine-specific elongation factor
MEPSLMVDCKLYYLKSASRPLKNRQRVRLYHGTSEIICRVVILDREEISPGGEAYVQLRLEKQLTSQRNDRFVIRSYSPMYTIGGGIIIEPAARKAKRFNLEYIKELKLKESGRTENILENTIKNLSGRYPGKEDILKAIGKRDENIQEELEKLVKSGSVIVLNEGEKPVYLHRGFLDEKVKVLQSILKDFHSKNPLKTGMSKEEIKNRVFGSRIKQKLYSCIVELLEDEGKVKACGSFISLKNFKVKYTPVQKKIKEKILSEFDKEGFIPPKYTEMEAGCEDKGNFKMVFESLIDSGDLVKIGENCCFLSRDYEKAKDVVVNFIRSRGSMSLAQLRDELNTSRKYATIFMEHFDSIKLTKRVGDSRVLY